MFFLYYLDYLVAGLWKLIKNDPLAFTIGILMFTMAGMAPILGVITLGYWIVLIVQAFRQQNLGLTDSLKRAMKATRTVETTSVSVINPDTEEQRTSAPSRPNAPAPVKFIGEFLDIRGEADVSEVEKALKSKILGQDHAVEQVVNTLKRVQAGIRKKKESPQATFLFLGPTGTGKTELVKVIARTLNRPLVRFDMPNYSSDAGTWELIGSPPGYAGSDKPGRLTGEIRANPDAILLLDEIEKANQKIWDPFLRVFDEGKMKDLAQGFTADFRKVMIFLTSNLLAQEEYIEDQKILRSTVLNSGYFRPELLNRIDCIIQFKKFSDAVIQQIIAQQIVSYISNFLKQNRIESEIVVDRAAISFILKNIDTNFGVRDVQRFVDVEIGNRLADLYVTKKSDIKCIYIVVEDNRLEVKR